MGVQDLPSLHSEFQFGNLWVSRTFLKADRAVFERKFENQSQILNQQISGAKSGVDRNRGFSVPRLPGGGGGDDANKPGDA